MKTAAGVPICGSTGSLTGCSVAFVLLSAFDADDADSVPAGVHCGRCTSACRTAPSNEGPQVHFLLLLYAVAFFWDYPMMGSFVANPEDCRYKDELVALLQSSGGGA